MMHIVDKEWIEKCRANPDKYKIYVDNDSVFVVDAETEETVEHEFLKYGYTFAKDLLEHLGCNVDFV